MISGDLSENISLFISMFLLFHYRGIVVSRKRLEQLMRLRRTPKSVYWKKTNEEVQASNSEIIEVNK